MLVLSRKRHERIVIFSGEQKIVIEVAGIHGDRVHIAIDAPRDVPIWRAELLAAIDQGGDVEPRG